MTNCDRLVILGRAMHGERWQRPVSRDLKHKSHRQVQRWADGEFETPDDVIERLMAIARARNLAITDAIKAAS